eukprot:3444226-Pyramimonas_sp.AAC.1
MEDVDVEALSGKAWKKFRDALAPGERQKPAPTRAGEITTLIVIHIVRAVERLYGHLSVTV